MSCPETFTGRRWGNTETLGLTASCFRTEAYLSDRPRGGFAYVRNIVIFLLCHFLLLLTHRATVSTGHRVHSFLVRLLTLTVVGKTKCSFLRCNFSPKRIVFDFLFLRYFLFSAVFIHLCSSTYFSRASPRCSSFQVYFSSLRSKIFPLGRMCSSFQVKGGPQAKKHQGIYR